MSTPQAKSPTPRSKPPAQVNISPTPQSTPPKIGPSLHPAPTAKKSQASGYSASNSPQQAQKHSQRSSIPKAAHGSSRGASKTRPRRPPHRKAANIVLLFSVWFLCHSPHPSQFSISAPISALSTAPRFPFPPHSDTLSLYRNRRKVEAGQLFRLERRRISNRNNRTFRKMVKCLQRSGLAIF